MNEQETVEYIRAHYDTKTAKELCAELGMTENHFHYFRKNHGIRKDPEVVRRMRSESMKRNRTDKHSLHSEETRRKMSETRKAIIRSERVRELYGLERRTRIQVFGGGDRVNGMRYRLGRKGYGVKRGSRDVTVLAGTERNAKMERNAAAMRFRFYGENGERIV